MIFIMKNKKLFTVLLSFAFIHATATAHNLYGNLPVPGFGMNQDDNGNWIDLQRFAEVLKLDGRDDCQSPSDNPNGGKLFRSGAPNFGGFIEGMIPRAEEANALATLKAHNVNLVVDLRSPSPHLDSAATKSIDDMYPTSTADEESVLIRNNISYINISIPQGSHVPHLDDTTTLHFHKPASATEPEIQGDVNDLNIYDAFRATVDTIREALKAATNVDVHCVHGADRTGTVIALYRSCSAAESEFGVKNFDGLVIDPPHDNYGGRPYLALGGLYHQIKTSPAGTDYDRAMKILKPLQSH